MSSSSDNRDINGSSSTIRFSLSTSTLTGLIVTYEESLELVSTVVVNGMSIEPRNMGLLELPSGLIAMYCPDEDVVGAPPTETVAAVALL